MINKNDIAIIGISLRFPEANNIEELWNNLLNKKESVKFFTDEELIKAGIEKSTIENKNYVKAAPVIEDIDKFDAPLFDYSPREAEMIDPQIRLFMECAWEAMEDSGYCADKYDGSVGVYGGSYVSHYLIKNMIHHVHESMKNEDELYTLYQCVNDFITTNVAYKLNLKGPSITIQSWCTSALSAVHTACQALKSKDCDMALAGTVNIRIPQEGYFYEPGGTDSPDGHSRSFDCKGKGTVPGNGVGILVLKPLENAMNDHDHIYAVIKGSAITNDGNGSQKLSYQGITVNGQVRAIKKALSDSCVDYDSVKYFELHGGATEIADRMEISAIKKAFKNHLMKKNHCAIGSIKPNIGNLGNASGIAGIIKTILILKNKAIPSTINFDELNIHNNLDNSPFYINKDTIELDDADKKLVACVNNYGIGGTNTCMILEEAPIPLKANEKKGMQLFTLSAKSNTAIKKLSEKLADFIERNPDLSIADIAYTLNTGRKDLNSRLFFVADSKQTLINKLREVKNSTDILHVNHTNEIYIVFSGHYNTDSGIIDVLCEKEPLFKEYYDEIYASLKDIIKSKNFKLANVYKGLCFDFAIGKLLSDQGIKISGMIGIGIGELSAAYLSGVLTPEIIKSKHKKTIDEIKYKNPKIPYISSVTNKWFDLQDIKSDYFDLIVNEQAYSDSIIGKITGNNITLIDIRGNSKDNIYKNHKDVLFFFNKSDDENNLLSLIGELWIRGLKINWNNFYRYGKYNKISLPAYPFEKKSYWIKYRSFASDTSKQSHLEDENEIYSRPQLSAEYESPLTDVEKDIAKMWETLFGIDKIGRNDDFIEIGGNSLHATMLLNKMNNSYKTGNITLRNLLDNPTVAQMADLIKEKLSFEDKKHVMDLNKIREFPSDQRIKLISDYLKSKIADYTNTSSAEIEVNDHISNLNLQSFVTELIWDIKNDFDVLFYSHEILKLPDILAFSKLLDDELFRMDKKSDKKSISISDFCTYTWVPEIVPNKIAEDKNESAVMIYSAGRSGSTILRIMLAGHSKLFCPPELDLLLFNSMKEWDNLIQKISPVAKDGLYYSLMEVFQCDYESAKNIINEYILKDLTTQEVYKIIQKNIPGKILVDKSPDYSHVKHIPPKAEMIFKNAKYIFLTRHPYPVIDSFVRNRFDKAMELETEYDPFMLGENMWATSNFNVLEFIKTIDRKKYFIVQFEELVKDPGKVMNGICDFLNIEFEETMINPYDGNKKRMIAGPGDPNVFNHDRINPGLGEKWKTISLPALLSEFSQNIAKQLNYFLPNEDGDSNKIRNNMEVMKNNPDQFKKISENIDNLSDEEVDKLLTNFLSDNNN